MVSLLLSVVLLAATLVPGDPVELGKTYADAIERLNAQHAAKPRGGEDELGGKLPEPARRAFDELLATAPSERNREALASALTVAANAAADLDLERDFEAASARLEQVDAKSAKALGVLVSRPRFVVRGAGGLEREYCERFADVFEAVLGGYDELFGFDEFSKLPGKKLRVLVHLEAKIERPPHFAPQFPYHSQIDFPVADASAFTSPTGDGKFLFYGLCHELGHVIAMWGDRANEEDRHTWAHYTGVAVVEHLSRDPKHAKLLEGLRDVKWRSLEKERAEAAAVEPGTQSKESFMALWIALHDSVGPKAIGDALDLLDKEDKRLRVNRVRYYELAQLERALLTVVKDDKLRKRVKELLK